jgi:hypothetical protein
MHWPTSIRQIQSLPEVGPLKDLKNPEHKYNEDPHNDEITDILTNYSNRLPYVILTYRSIYLFDWTHEAPVNVHIRSENSIETYGSNISVKLSPNQQTFAVITDKNVILVYTIKINGSNNELLTVYSKNDTLVQNGFPLTSYKPDSLMYGGLNSKFEIDKNSQNQGIVKNLISSLIGIDGLEIPIMDLGLRLKLILNVASPIVEYCFINSMDLLLINTNPHAFQIIHLNSKSSLTSNQTNTLTSHPSSDINFILADELEWFNNPEINNKSEITSMNYNYDLDCFLWNNLQGDVLLVKRTGSSANLKFSANVVYKSNGQKKKSIKALINHCKNTCYILLEDGTLLIYKLKDDFTCKLLKIIEPCLPSKIAKDLYLHPFGDSIIVLYSNGWNIHSVLGNLNFSTFEYDKLKISNIKKIQFISQLEMILVNTENQILFIDLTVCNSGEGFNALSLKRPVLYDSTKLSIFKAYEKKLIEHHHYNYNINDVTNKETNVWLTEMLPLSFRINNNIIRSCSVSDDGNNVCVVGNYDVVIFNNITKKWKFLEITQDTANFEKHESAIKKCCWWKNYLILGLSNNDKTKGSEIIIFSEKILEINKTFSFDFIVWNFNFKDTPYDENFINFNIDLYNDILFAITDGLNCYSWKLKLNTNGTKKISGDYQNQLMYDESLRSLKSYVTLEKSIVYQLKTCFKDNDESIILNYGTIMQTSDSDILFLTNTDLYYIKREKLQDNYSFAYNTYLINDTVEYIYKLNNSLVCLFDGSQLIHYNLNDDPNLLKLKPIEINIGNDIIKNVDGYTVKYTGVCPYPITTISNQNVMFGIEIDCFNKLKLRLETNRRNYLTDLVNHYILSNISIKNEDDSNAMNIITVYGKFSKFKNFKFVLEKLMVDYLQNCYEDKSFDLNDDYFSRLYSLINLTGSLYEIILNCLKKTETHFWPIFFTKAKENPRYIVNRLFTENDNQKLTAHFFIIMLNYEKYDKNNSREKYKNKKKKKSTISTISNNDQDIIINILKKLIVSKDFETSFELVRFLKIVDEKMTHNCLEKMKTYLKNE